MALLDCIICSSFIIIFLIALLSQMFTVTYTINTGDTIIKTDCYCHVQRIIRTEKKYGKNCTIKKRISL